MAPAAPPGPVMGTHSPKHTSRDWPAIYAQDLPRRQADLFDRLSARSGPSLLVTGCQRSGTTWTRKLLADRIEGAFATSELEGCNYLLRHIDLEIDDDRPLVLQTTFSNTMIEAYRALPRHVKVIVLGRAPRSVCWSLVDNWNNLELEFSQRASQCGEAPVADRWRMAVAIYRGSAVATAQILHDRPEATRFVRYDRLVEHGAGVLADLAAFLAPAMKLRLGEVVADPAPSRKHREMPKAFRMLIDRECRPAYDRLMATLPNGCFSRGDGNDA